MNFTRYFLNLFGSILVKIRYRKLQDPFKIFHNLIEKEKVIEKSKSKGTYIIAPVRVSPTSNLFEALMGYFFKLRGYEVKAIMCDQAVSFCDNISKNEANKNVKCALCKKEQERFCNLLGFEKLSVKNNIDPSEIERIKVEVEKRDFKKGSDFIFDDVDLYNDIYSGTLRYTLKSDIKKEDTAILKKAASTAFLYSVSVKKILKQEKPIGVLMSHGIYSTWGTILSVCKYLKINTVVWGRGYVGQGNIIFAHNSSSHDESIFEDNKIWKEYDLSSEEKKLTIDHFHKKINRTGKVEHVDYYENLNSTDFNTINFYNSLKKYTKVYGMFTNIPWDGQVFNKTEGFPNTTVYIKNTIEWFIKNPECILAIRAHPAERTRTAAKGTETFEELLMDVYPTLPANVIFLKPENPITSYELSKHIDVAILHGSTLSLEFAMSNIPVIQTGRYNVSGKGVVFECKTKEEYWNFLEIVKKGKLEYTEQMKTDILKYAHYWIYKRHIEDTTVHLENLLFKNFKFKSISEFKQNNFLNFVSQSILDNSKIINSLRK